MSKLHLSLFFMLCMWKVGANVNAEGIVVPPSSIFRDDMLFDILWPGDNAKAIGSDSLTEEVYREPSDTTSDSSVGLFAGLTNEILSEVDYSEPEFLDMRTAYDEKYFCEMPHWSASDKQKESEGTDDVMNSPEELIKSLKSRCTRLAMGYWTYELCHGIHVKQFHESKETKKKEIKKPGDALDEYLLGVPKSRKSKAHYSDTDSISKSSQLESTGQDATDKEEKKVIPVWLYNGNEYPYYEVQFGDGTSCDLKDGSYRSISVRYICDLESHSTGTLLHLEEVSTCKYEAVVAISNLCQNKQYRLREDPVYSLKCFPKEGSPTKPKSLLEHEIIMAQYSQRTKRSKKTKSHSSKDVKKYDEEEEKEEDPKDFEMKDKSRDFPASRTHSDHLDENFIRSFLSGDLCLRGGSGWWQHEVCYGKYVKQLHEEMGKTPVEVVLGRWVEEGHKRWFTSSSTTKRQSNNFVIHLYMNGDVCDITGVARQCQVKFRCSSSNRLSEVSIYLEEPTTCNYILTVEAAFLCPLLKNTDELGMFTFPSGGIESLEKAMKEKDGKDNRDGKEGRRKETDKEENSESQQEVVVKRGGTELKKLKEETDENNKNEQEEYDQRKKNSRFDGYNTEDELDDKGNPKVGRRGEESNVKPEEESEQESTDKKTKQH